MTSTASQRLRLDKQATGDNPDAWGDRLNGVIDLVDEAFGFAEIAVNGNVTLSAQNFVSDQSRRMVLRFTGSGGFAVTIPAVEKMFYIDNRCAADVVLKTSATPGSAVVAGTKRIAYCDGATVTTDTSSTAPPASASSVTPVGGIQATNVQSALQELDAEKARLDGATFTGQVRAAQTSGGMATATGGLAKLAVEGVEGSANAAFMSFNRANSFAGYLGLDTDNTWKVGGWTSGAVAYTLWHSGNLNPAGYAALGGNASFNRLTLTEGGTGTSLTFGDDAAMGDVNISNTVGLRGQQNPAQGFMQMGSGGARFGYDGSNPVVIGGSNLFLQPSGGGNFAVWHMGNLPSGSFAATGGNVSFNRVAITENGTGASLQIGNDATMGDVDISNTVGLRGAQSAAQGYMQFGSGGSRFGHDGSNPVVIGGTNLFLQPSAGGSFGAWHSGNFTPGNYLARTGGTMIGNVDLQFNQPTLYFTSPGNYRLYQWLTNDGTFHIRADGASDDRFRVDATGALWTSEVGDYRTYIEARATAKANARQAQIAQDATATARRFNIDGTYIIDGTGTFTTDANGEFAMAFPWAFPTATIATMVCNGDATAGGAAAVFSVRSPDRFGVFVRLTGGSVAGITVRVNYHAVGY